MANVLYGNYCNAPRIDEKVTNGKIKAFGGLAGMSTISDRKDLMQMPQYTKTFSVMEKSLDFLKSTQNEIYSQLHQELDNLKMENKELKLKLVLLSNSTEFFTNFPMVEQTDILQNKGVHAQLLGQHIKEMNKALIDETKTKDLLMEKIQVQQKEIYNLKIQLNEKISDEIIMDVAPLKKHSMEMRENITDLQLHNQKIVMSTNKTEIENSYFPTTVQGCQKLIRFLIKSKDKLETDNKLLQYKLKRYLEHYKKDEFMKKFANNRSTYFSSADNNSNVNRLFSLPKIVKLNKSDVHNFNKYTSSSFFC